MPMLITGDPLDALTQAVDAVLPLGSPERLAFDASMTAVKASPEAQAVRNAISSMCQALTPTPPAPPNPPTPPTPPATPSQGVSAGAAVGIGAGGAAVGFLAGMMVGRGMKK